MKIGQLDNDRLPMKSACKYSDASCFRTSRLTPPPKSVKLYLYTQRKRGATQDRTMRTETPTMMHVERAYSSTLTPTRRPRSQSAPRTRLAMHRQDVVYRNSSSGFTGSTTSLSKENGIAAQPTTHNRIVINVGGRRFQTTVETLLKVPDTVLSELARSHLTLSRDQQVYEYFFDRSAIMFEDIIDYYRTGSLHFPQDACPDKVKQEMDFWKLPRSALSDSSWLRYLRQREVEYERDTIRKLLSARDAAADKKVLRVGNATAVVYDAPSFGGTISRLYHDVRVNKTSFFLNSYKDTFLSCISILFVDIFNI